MKKKDKLNKNIFIENCSRLHTINIVLNSYQNTWRITIMKKLFSVLAVTTLAIGIVAGCGKEEKKIQLVKTRYKRLNKAVNL